MLGALSDKMWSGFLDKCRSKTKWWDAWERSKNRAICFRASFIIQKSKPIL